MKISSSQLLLSIIYPRVVKLLLRKNLNVKRMNLRFMTRMNRVKGNKFHGAKLVMYLKELELTFNVENATVIFWTLI